MRKEYIISENFKNNIKVENLLIEISSIFEEGRYTKEINYKVDFQRNFVWDNDKKTYLIESILLKTEIPPIIIFDNNIENQVIDGRQRCETIERYMNNEFPLRESGLKVLKSFSGKYYRDLPEKIKIEFSETKLRILKFSFVNKENVNENEEELIKREIFRRYNSGIISLKKEEIERAEYIHDKLTSNLTNKLEKDNEFFNIVKSLFFKRDNNKKIYRDMINALLYKLRRIIILSEVPIKSYAYSNKADLTLKYCYYYKEKFKSEKLIELYYEYFKILYHIQQKLKERKNKFWNNPLFYECLCWCLNILNNNINIKSENLTNDIINFFYLNRNNKIWKMMPEEDRDLEKIFMEIGSHYKAKIFKRYLFTAMYFENKYFINFDKYLDNKEKNNKIIKYKDKLEKELNDYSMKKLIPVTMPIKDIIKKIKAKRFIVRPKYQRSEVKNQNLAFYLLESILLGIKIPSIYVYKHNDENNTIEVIDGQQRILSVLAFLGEKYLDSNYQEIQTIKNKFKLKNLKILSEYNNKNIDEIDEEYKNKILNFKFDFIEIEEKENLNFNCIDLFIRLNKNPYPIKINSFEMWNGYINKEIATKIRDLAAKYEKIIFLKNNKRMKVEELITSLIYLDFKEQKGFSVYDFIEIYIVENKTKVRIKSKEKITKTLDELYEGDIKLFIKSIDNINEFIIKICILLNREYNMILNLFSESNLRKSKKDGNFYILWFMLKDMKKEYIEENRKKLFLKISKIFELLQKEVSFLEVKNMIESIRNTNKPIILLDKKEQLTLSV